MAEITAKDQVTLGVARLTSMWSDKPNVVGLLTSFLESIQGIEEVYADILTSLNLDSAVGVQLDTLGLIVGQPRGGRGDGAYREAIKLRIAINNSDGTEPVVTPLVLALTGAEKAEVSESFPASVTYVLSGDDVDVSADIITDINKIFAATVSLNISTSLTGVDFRTIDRDDTNGSDPLGLSQGFNYFEDPTPGGYFQDYQELTFAEITVNEQGSGVWYAFLINRNLVEFTTVALNTSATALSLAALINGVEGVTAVTDNANKITVTGDRFTLYKVTENCTMNPSWISDHGGIMIDYNTRSFSEGNTSTGISLEDGLASDLTSDIRWWIQAAGAGGVTDVWDSTITLAVSTFGTSPRWGYATSESSGEFGSITGEISTTGAELLEVTVAPSEGNVLVRIRTDDPEAINDDYFQTVSLEGLPTWNNGDSVVDVGDYAVTFNSYQHSFIISDPGSGWVGGEEIGETRTVSIETKNSTASSKSGYIATYTTNETDYAPSGSAKTADYESFTVGAFLAEEINSNTAQVEFKVLDGTLAEDWMTSVITDEFGTLTNTDLVKYDKYMASAEIPTGWTSWVFETSHNGSMNGWVNTAQIYATIDYTGEVVTSFEEEVANFSPLTYWQMDDANTLTDSTGLNNGTFGAGVTDGQDNLILNSTSGGSVDFDGGLTSVGTAAIYPHIGAANQDFTVSTLVRFTNSNNDPYQTLFGHEQGTSGFRLSNQGVEPVVTMSNNSGTVRIPSRPALTTTTGAPQFVRDIAVKTSSTTSFSFTVECSVDSNAHYIVVNTGSSEPTAAQIQAGLDSNNATPVKAANGVITANSEVTISALTLGADTTYDVWVALADSGDANSNTVYGFSASTGTVHTLRTELITVTRDTSQNLLSLYRNGDLVESITVPGSDDYSIFSGNTLLGTNIGADTWEFVGSMDDTTVYDIALSSNQVHSLYSWIN